MVVLNHYGCNTVFGHSLHVYGKSVALFLTLPANQRLALLLQKQPSCFYFYADRTPDWQICFYLTIERKGTLLNTCMTQCVVSECCVGHVLLRKRSRNVDFTWVPIGFSVCISGLERTRKQLCVFVYVYDVDITGYSRWGSRPD